MKTYFFDPLTLVRMLNAGSEYSGNPIKFLNTREQNVVAGLYAKYRNQLSLVTEGASWASNSIAVINAQAIEEGFEIQLQDVPLGPNEFAVLATLALEENWLQQGEAVDSCLVGGKIRSMFIVEKGIQVKSVSGYTHPVVVATFTNGDTMLMTKVSGGNFPNDPFELLENIQVLTEQTATSIVLSDYNAVILPCADLKVNPPIGCLVGLSTGSVTLAEAKAEILFKLNRDGVVVKSAAMASFLELASNPTPYIMDDSFVFAIFRNGVTLPLVYGLIGEDDFMLA